MIIYKKKIINKNCELKSGVLDVKRKNVTDEYNQRH